MNQKERGENRKALPKFFVTMALSLLAGGVIGFLVGFSHVFGLDTAGFARRLDEAILTATPWGIPVTSVPVLGAAFLLYRSAARKFTAWDGGDEDETSQAIETLLSWALLLSSVQLLINFFFFAALSTVRPEEGAFPVVGLFILSCGLVVFAQQKVVDLERRMNPEKRGSVYDMKFQEKWYGSMDESERQQLGQACYRAYMVTSRFCIFLWLVLVILSFIFEMSVLPVFVLLLVWGVMQVTYTLECIRLSKKQSA